MITKISFENYKLFKEEQELELKPLTILIGKNSSGKSAITKLLPLIDNSLKGDIGLPVSLMNFGVKLGSEFRDIIYGRHEVGVLSFGIQAEDNRLDIQIASGTRSSDFPKITSWKLATNNHEGEYKYDDRSKNYIDTKNDEEHELLFDGFNLHHDILIYDILDDEDKIKYTKEEALDKLGFQLNTNYIGPYRFIPDRIIELFQSIKNGKLQIDGKAAYPFLIEDTLHNKGQLLNKLNKWYKEIFEGWTLKVNVDNPPYYELQLVRDTPDVEVNFSDVGQGMIQSLPLLLSSFLPNQEKNTINVFEQPELHLHPAVHGDIAERFATSTIELGKRYLIETHSQNFVLRLRRLVAEGKLDKENLVIYYVDFDEEKGESNLKRINVDNKGRVDYWPPNVFSETLDETTAIRTAQMETPYHAS